MSGGWWVVGGKDASSVNFCGGVQLCREAWRGSAQTLGRPPRLAGRRNHEVRVEREEKKRGKGSDEWGVRARGHFVRWWAARVSLAGVLYWVD